MTITTDGTIEQSAPIDWNRIEGSGARIQELVSDGRQVFALVGRELDDRFHDWPGKDGSYQFVCAMTGEAECRPLSGRAIHHSLRIESGVAVTSTVETREDVIALIRQDFSAIRGTGVAALGENNLEGRVSWSSVYFLNGLISLAERIPELREEAKQRLAIEIGHLEALYDTYYPGLQVKRYSLDREPTVALINYGRAGTAIQRAGRLGLLEVSPGFEAKIEAGYAPRESALEKLRKDDAHGFYQFVLTPHFPFWADGANVPWNYQSAWIQAVANSKDARMKREFGEIAGSMIEALLATENLREGVTTWNYSYGQLTDGWEPQDHISTNTPNYAGDQANTRAAHISYRSMDAMAVIAAHRTRIAKLDRQTRDHLFSLADEGHLLPLVMAEFTRDGHELALPEDQIVFHGRSLLPYDTENQVWAMDQLIRRLD